MRFSLQRWWRGRDFVDESEHVEWVRVFDHRLSPEQLAILQKLHDLSYQAEEGGAPQLTWVDEAAFLPTLMQHDHGTEPTYEDLEQANRDLEALTEAGFVEPGTDKARPTYAGCVRVERSRPGTPPRPVSLSQQVLQTQEETPVASSQVKDLMPQRAHV